MNSVLFFCPCLSLFNSTTSPNTTSSTFLPLSNLYFCEECDEIRCNYCSNSELISFFCSHCLFEVPITSTIKEKNRCARNCFQCPQCDHALTTTAATTSNPEDYYLTCSFCLWDSNQVNISFEKPTGLAQQLQKFEDTAPEIREYDAIKNHFDAFLRTSTNSIPSTSSASPYHHSTILSRSNFGITHKTRSAVASSSSSTTSKLDRDELQQYTSTIRAENYDDEDVENDMTGEERELERVKMMREMTDIEMIPPLEKRWTTTWQQSMLATKLKPLRTPLQSKRSKRCPTCSHILIKPEQKSTSTRFKIKLIAANYLPAITVYRRPPPTLSSRLSTLPSTSSTNTRRTTTTRSATGDEEPLRPGRTYSFELTFTNPLYEIIQVKLAVARPSPSSPTTTTTSTSTIEPPYAVNLPSPSFPISAFAEAWEYEEDENAFDREDEDKSPSKKRGGGKMAGVVERKGNKTTVLMEVAVGKETIGVIKANMLVTYTYQSDDPISPFPPPPSSTSSTTLPPSALTSPNKKSTTTTAANDNLKSFSFWTLFTLGTVQPRVSRTLNASTTSTN